MTERMGETGFQDPVATAFDGLARIRRRLLIRFPSIDHTAGIGKVTHTMELVSPAGDDGPSYLDLWVEVDTSAGEVFDWGLSISWEPHWKATLSLLKTLDDGSGSQTLRSEDSDSYPDFDGFLPALERMLDDLISSASAYSYE